MALEFVQHGIIQTPWKSYMDLSRLVEMTRAYFVPDIDGWYPRVGFQTVFQLVEKTQHYNRLIRDDECHVEGKDRFVLIKRADGAITPCGQAIGHRWELDLKEGEELVAVLNLQTEIDQIAAAWMEFKKSTASPQNG